MTEQEILALDPALDDYLARFLFCCDYTQTFDHLGTYCRGLLSDLPRKTAEPIALAAGVAVRTFQLFLTQHGWDQFEVRDLLQRHVASLLPRLVTDDIGSVGVIDESGHVKKGEKTPGVQRQYCGEVGKTENCIVTVHLSVARQRYKSLIDADLFLPLKWSQDRARCREADIPDELVHRPKWKIALEQVDRAVANGMKFDWLTLDEGYGCAFDFLDGLRQRNQRYVGEVPRSWWCFARADAAHPSRADDLVRFSPLFGEQAWQTISLPRETLGEQVWQYKAARVWPSHEGEPAKEACWLIWMKNERTGEEKYFVSNASATLGVGLVVRAAFRRWNVEHAIRLGKQEMGLKHYEGRSYVGLMRHLILSLVSMNFVAEQAAGLRGEKSGGDGGAGVPRDERGNAAVAGTAATDEPREPHGGGDPVPSETQPSRPRVEAETTGRSAGRRQASTPAQAAVTPQAEPV